VNVDAGGGRQTATLDGAGEMSITRRTLSGLGWTFLGTLAASDLFVFPSYQREGIPRVLLEAAAMALLIVTTDAPGCNDVVEHNRNGLLVPARDSCALAGAIIRLVDSPELRERYGRAARAPAEQQFALSVVAGETRTIYERLLAGKGLTAAGQPVVTEAVG
jgi:glycosyltransferase involved in cell wall biosynthesis